MSSCRVVEHVPSGLVDLVAAGGLVVLSGAGMSTGSGIPDYRGVTGRTRSAPPMQWAEFRDDEHARRRYWARGSVGFRRHLGIRPNAGHRAVARLEAAGLVDRVVTQNVDGLHQTAGSADVVELHGSLSRARCLECGRHRDRRDLQRALDEANPWLVEVDAPVQADGDAVLGAEHVGRFEIVRCGCGGEYRPDVVFFGELVPRQRIADARDAIDRARGLLVLGSSLTVGTGFMLVRHALRGGVPVRVVNRGPTRADGLLEQRVDADLQRALPDLVDRVLGATAA